MKNFKERLEYLMKRRNITSQYQLSQQTGIRLNVINGWFTGNVKFPSEKHLMKLAEFFNINPSWLRYGEKKFVPSINNEIQRLAIKIQKFIERYPDGIKTVENTLDLLFKEYTRAFKNGIHIERKLSKNNK